MFPLVKTGSLKISCSKRHYAIIDRYKLVNKQTEKDPLNDKIHKKLNLKPFEKEKSNNDQINIKPKSQKFKMPKIPLQSPEEAMNNIKYELPVQPRNPKSLNISVIGAPNAGKSTLINRLVGTKVTAVSTKAHTTRELCLGISTIGDTQLIFTDTPGIVNTKEQPKGSVEKFVNEAWGTVFSTDMALLIVDGVKSISRDKNLPYIMEKLASYREEMGDKFKAILVINKYDLVEEIPLEKRKPTVGKFEKYFPNIKQVFNKIFTISALTGKSVVDLEQYLINSTKESHWEFSSNTVC